MVDTSCWFISFEYLGEKSENSRGLGDFLGLKSTIQELLSGKKQWREQW
jgi:hypothetical protein